jgi:tetratricopeptide (TPR) repeat protein
MGLDDCKASFLAANLGLKSNPDDAILHNNAAYALIELGDLEKAKLELSKIDMGKISNYEYVTASATWGLYYFRNGQLELGRKHYERSLDIARNLPNSEWEAMASVMFAREEILLGNEAARELLSKAERAAARTDSALIRRWLEIDKRLIGTSLKS